MERPRVLLLDDGELSRIYAILKRMRVEPMRVSGDDIQDGLPMPRDLLITTGRRTLHLRRADPHRFVVCP